MNYQETPITINEEEGKDRVTQGANPSGAQLIKIDGISTHNVYANGGKPGITDPKLLGEGLGAPEEMVALAPVVEALKRARSILSQEGDLVVFNAFIDPKTQLAKYQRIASVYGEDVDLNDSEQVYKLGEKADCGGSVASAIKDSPAYKALMAEYQKNQGIIAAARASNQELIPFIEKLIDHQASMGRVNVPVDVRSATTVHNHGLSVNVGFKRGGEMQNMGIGLDTPFDNPVQGVDWFEKNDADAYKKAAERDAGIQRYLEAMNAGPINADLIAEIRNNRRVLFGAMRTAGFDFYKGEQGHFTLPVDPANRPDREGVYEQAKAFGYQIA